MNRHWAGCCLEEALIVKPGTAGDSARGLPALMLTAGGKQAVSWEGSEGRGHQGGARLGKARAT